MIREREGEVKELKSRGKSRGAMGTRVQRGGFVGRKRIKSKKQNISIL